MNGFNDDWTVKNPYHVPPRFDGPKTDSVLNWLRNNPNVATISITEARQRFPAFFGDMPVGAIQKIILDALEIAAQEKNIATGATQTQELRRWTWMDFIA